MSPESTLRLRKLPGGPWCAGKTLDLVQHSLRVSMEPEAPTDELGIGSLLEVETPEMIYLGETENRQGLELLIGVKHILNRDRLAEITRLWQATNE